MFLGTPTVDMIKMLYQTIKRYLNDLNGQLKLN